MGMVDKPELASKSGRMQPDAWWLSVAISPSQTDSHGQTNKGGILPLSDTENDKLYVS